MSRTVLALMLALLLPVAQAADAPRDAATAPACSKPEASAGKDAAGEGDASAQRPGAPAPVRPRAAGNRSLPRWHSGVPGMYR